MLVIAKSIKGKEFLYNPKSARKVSKASAEKICKIVNEYKFLLGSNENEVWHIHEVFECDAAYNYAQFQSFTIRNGIVTARSW